MSFLLPEHMRPTPLVPENCCYPCFVVSVVIPLYYYCHLIDISYVSFAVIYMTYQHISCYSQIVAIVNAFDINSTSGYVLSQ